MKKASIYVHGNQTLSRVVQELAFKSGYYWYARPQREPRFDQEALSYILVGFEGRVIDGVCGHNSDPMCLCRDKSRFPGMSLPQIDAATEFDKVIAFFEQPQRPVIKVGEHTVEWMDAQNAIKVGRTVVPAETVKAIHDELFKK